MTEDKDLMDFGIDVEDDYEEYPFTWIENYILDTKGLSANKKMVYVMLRRYAGRKKDINTGKGKAGELARPSVKLLMQTSGIKSNKTVIKAIQFFEWFCWLEKIQFKNDDGLYWRNRYILKLKQIPKILDILKERKVSLEEVEHYFDTLCTPKTKHLLKENCIFLTKDFSKEKVKEILTPYEKPPKKKKEPKS